MYTIEDIKALIKAVDDSGIDELEVKGGEETGVVIRKTPTGTVQQVAAPSPQTAATPIPTGDVQSNDEDAEEPQAPSDDQNVQQITSPMVGTFYRSPSPDADPYIHAGDRVNESTVVCIVEAMKLMNEIEAEIEGEIKEILVENGELVDYGQPLFLVTKGT